MIPKIIHCCWLGGGPKTNLAQKCRESWIKFAPGWRILEWTLDEVRTAASRGMFPALPRFFEDAVKAGKWAFAADWVRFAALEAEGGLYLDYDVELVRPIEADGEFVAGQWIPGGLVGEEPAIIALEKGSAVAKAMLEHYADVPFDINYTAGVALGSVLCREGIKVKVLDPEVFCPIGLDGVLRTTERTIGVHHYAMSWAGSKQQILRWLSWHGMRGLVDLALRVRRVFGKNAGGSQ